MKKPQPITSKNNIFIIGLGADEKKEESLGEYLIRKKLINREILEFALSIQKETNDLLGDILQKEGYISEKLLQEYSINRLFNPNRTKSFAAFLVKIGKIDLTQKEELLLKHRKSGRSLAAILIDDGIISPRDFTQEKIIQLAKLKI